MDTQPGTRHPGQDRQTDPSDGPPDCNPGDSEDGSRRQTGRLQTRGESERQTIGERGLRPSRSEFRSRGGNWNLPGWTPRQSVHMWTKVERKEKRRDSSDGAWGESAGSHPWTGRAVWAGSESVLSRSSPRKEGVKKKQEEVRKTLIPGFSPKIRSIETGLCSGQSSLTGGAGGAFVRPSRGHTGLGNPRRPEHTFPRGHPTGNDPVNGTTRSLSFVGPEVLGIAKRYYHTRRRRVNHLSSFHQTSYQDLRDTSRRACSDPCP